MTIWTKDPADEDWYEFDWSGTDSSGNTWLPTGVTISSYTLTVDSALTKISDMLGATSSVGANPGQAASSVFFKVSGGVPLAQSNVECTITTTDGNVYAATKTIFIRNRIS